jgi:Ribonuclease G/E
MTAIDVDGADRTGAPESFATDLNLAAAEETARQIGLRSIGGRSL